MHSIHCCVNFLSPLSVWSPFQTYPDVVNECSRLAILSMSTLRNFFLFITEENGVQSQVTDCEICSGRSGTAVGFSYVSSVSVVNHHSTPSPYSFITALCAVRQPWPDSTLPYLLSSQSAPSSLTPHLACYRGMKFEFYPAYSVFTFIVSTVHFAPDWTQS